MASWRDHIKVHPAADLFPMMSGEELKALSEDIKKHGLIHPIVIWSPDLDDDGNEIGGRFLLDGRNRLDAAEAAGMLRFDDDGQLWCRDGGIDDEFRHVYATRLSGGEYGEDPYACVIPANLHRRHLDGAGKRKLIAKLLKQFPQRSNLQIAKMLGVDDKTVASVRQELEGRSEIPNAETRTDTKGRQQPSRKPERSAAPTVTMPPTAPVMPARSEARKATYAADDEIGIPGRSSLSVPVTSPAEPAPPPSVVAVDNVGQSNLKNVFLMNCAATAQVVREGYRGPIDKQVLAAADRTAKAWADLASTLRNRLTAEAA
jgi:hypothetical protein